MAHSHNSQHKFYIMSLNKRINKIYGTKVDLKIYILFSLFIINTTGHTVYFCSKLGSELENLRQI